MQCVVWLAVPGGVHHVFQVEYERVLVFTCMYYEIFERL
jgi:hypothetical protein